MSGALPQRLEQVLQQINGVVLGKPQQVRLAVSCLLARGHLLIEDLPGMGKTTLAEALARSFGLSFNRVNFTNDLLPADLIGVSIYEKKSETFQFHQGPLFCNVLLADEINRASPRTQSALLEAMSSKVVSVDGISHPLPQPFFVIATQNGLDQTGTSPLPESQLDRFLMRISLGFPDREAERNLLLGHANPVHQLENSIDSYGLIEAQQQCSELTMQTSLLDYVLDLLATSRYQNSPASLSPRAGLGLLSAARGWALMEQRKYVIPADVISVFTAIAEHRLDAGQPRGHDSLSQQLLKQVDAIR